MTRQPAVWRFGACQLHTLRRELSVNGVPHTLAPKVFELLLLLLRNRARVVPRDELRDALWPGAELSDSVLARTVMKLRRAIGDTDRQRPLIQSVHGVGYRFAGEVHGALPEDASAASRTAPPEPVLLPRAPGPQAGQRASRIGVLPIVNATGDAQLDWARTGLMALVGHVLEADERLAVVPATTVSQALADLPVSTAPAAAASQARDALGLEIAVHAVLRRQGALLWLDFHVNGRGGQVHSGSLGGSHAIELGERLAEAVHGSLFAGEHQPLAVVSGDPFICQAYARGTELFRLERWQEAQLLFDVVCVAEPDSLVALAAQAQNLALLEDPRAEGQAQLLLQRAMARHEDRLQAQAHALIAYAMTQRRDDADVATRVAHCEAGMRLGAACADEDWVIWHRINRATRAMLDDRFPKALQLFAEAEAASRTQGNTYRLSQLQMHMGLIDFSVGNLPKARERLSEACTVHQRLGHRRSHIQALSLLALVNASLGELDTAFAQCDALLGEVDSLRSPGWECQLLVAAARVYAERGAADSVRRVLAAYSGIADQSHPLVRSAVLASRGCLALCHGDLAQARASLREALAVGRAVAGTPWARISLMTLLRIETAAQDSVAARAWVQHIVSVPSYAHDAELRAAVLHAQAAENLMAGDRDAALRVLGSIAEHVPFGREQACARFDAAWLHAEQGQVDAADALLGGLGAWCDEHPIGLSTRARVLFARQQPEAAARAQRLALQRHLGPSPAWHEQALRHYACGDAGPGRLHGLASNSWAHADRAHPHISGPPPRVEDGRRGADMKPSVT